MDLMGCLGCPGTYEVGLPQCPHCGTRSPMYAGGEDEMPKATSGGASNAWLEMEPGYQPPVEAGAVEAAEVSADAEVTAAGEHGSEPTGLPEGGMVPGAVPSLPVERGAPPEPGVVTVAAVPPVESMSKSELQDHADSLGLSTSGTKADLAARIVEHHEVTGGVAEEPAPAVEPEA